MQPITWGDATIGLKNNSIGQRIKARCMLLAVALLVLPSSGLSRTNYAIVIGVSEYQADLGYKSLEGARNDALLVFEFLKQKGFASHNIALLTEDSPQSVRPTRKAILNALDNVVEKLKPGDFIYFHFSGHGSQQPSLDADETDGLDEIILPADTGRWSEAKKTVLNVITDNVIAEYVARIRAKQAFIWMVFDSCHSGTMTRGNITSRKILPQSLGIPLIAARQRGVPVPGVNRSPIEVDGRIDQAGGYIGFFAAQTDQETPEMPQALDIGDETAYGLFTFNLVKVLARYPDINYQQAAEQILKNYAAHPWYATTPYFTGTHMDARIFGNQRRDKVKQWKLDKIEGKLLVNAGELHQIGKGAILAVIADPAASAEQFLGYVKTTDVGDLRSTVIPTHLEGDEFPVKTRKLDQVISFDAIPASAYARLIATNYSISLSLGIIETAAPVGKKSTRGEQVIARLRAEGLYPLALNWVHNDRPSDIKLLNTGDDIYILADYENLPCPHGPCDDEKPGQTYIKVSLSESKQGALKELKTKLRVIAKTLNLMRLSNTMDATDLVVKMRVRDVEGEVKEILPSERPTLYAGDEISLIVANETEEPQDLTVLFVDSSYGIKAIYPAKNQFNRFMSYDEKEILLGKINVETTGPESLIIIANSVFRTSPNTDFRFLEQEKLIRTRGISESGISQLLSHFQSIGVNQPDPGHEAEPVWIDAETSKKGSIQVFQWITGVRPGDRTKGR